MKFQVKDLAVTEPVVQLWLEQMDDNEVRLWMKDQISENSFILMRFRKDGQFRRINSLPNSSGLQKNKDGCIKEVEEDD